MSDYIEVYGYKPETFAGMKYAFTSKSFRITHEWSNWTVHGPACVDLGPKH